MLAVIPYKDVAKLFAMLNKHVTPTSLEEEDQKLSKNSYSKKKSKSCPKCPQKTKAKKEVIIKPKKKLIVSSTQGIYDKPGRT